MSREWLEKPVREGHPIFDNCGLPLAAASCVPIIGVLPAAALLVVSVVALIAGGIFSAVGAYYERSARSAVEACYKRKFDDCTKKHPTSEFGNSLYRIALIGFGISLLALSTLSFGTLAALWVL